jgi:hypothetical protein
MYTSDKFDHSQCKTITRKEKIQPYMTYCCLISETLKKITLGTDFQDVIVRVWGFAYGYFLKNSFINMINKKRSICMFANQLRKEHYLPHAILKISRNNDINDHVLGATS